MKTEAIEDVFELSPLQKGILFQSLYADAGMYVQQLSFEVNAPINIDAYRRAWQSSLDRHTAVRTSFYWEDVEQPVQVVQRDIEMPLRYEDWSYLAPSEQIKRLEAYLQEDRKQGFDLSQPPLIRIGLICLAPNCFQFIITFHHLILDGWSLAMLFAEVTSFYEAYYFGRQLKLPPASQYGSYIEWLQAQDQTRADAYWSRILAGYKGPSPFCIDRKRGRAESPADTSGELHLKLSTELTSALHSFARQHQLTINTLFQGAWAILISRYVGTEDVVFGAVVSGRPALLAGVETIIGLFINTLPVRVTVRSKDSLLCWLKQLQADQFEAREFDYSPLNRIQSLSETARGNRLFNSLLAFENYPVQNNNSNGALGRIDFFEGNDYPLSVTVAPGAEIGIKISYQQRFDAAAVARLLEHLRELLQAIVSSPGKCLGELTLLNKAEVQSMLSMAQGISTDIPRTCIHQLLEQQAERTPDALAVVCGDQRLTYREIDHQSNQLAGYLQKLGVGPETVVATYFERSSELLIAILGILKSGGAYLPLDPEYPQHRTALILNDARPRAVLTSTSLRPGITCQCPVISIDEDHAVFPRQPTTRSTARVAPENLAYMIYTSGSTGVPKGVLVEHKALVNHSLAIARAYHLTAADRVLQFTSVGFDVFAEEVFPTLLTGGVVVLRPAELVSSFEAFHDYVTKQKITVLNLPASYWQEWVSDLTGWSNKPPSCVRLVVVGNERVSPARWTEWFATAGTEIKLRNAYGPTEATITTTIYEATADGADIPSVPIGKPITNTTVFILDPELRPVPLGVPGELYIGGEGLARGYLNNPDLTAAAFFPNPFGKGSRLYRTGDIGWRLPDGNIEFLGRSDNQVKIIGHRVELEEVESVLRSHPAVKKCAVAAYHDDSHSRLIGYVVPRQAKPELWPSIGEYFLYDPVMYHAMTHDERRNNIYRVAINRHVKEKVVLDIGTGADAIMARMCVDAGARRVYAIEKLAESYEKARQLLARLNLDNRIILVHGESTEIELPEKVDVCVSELLGMIGSAEGVVPILNNARRFLRESGVMIPSRCNTKIAAVTLPDEIRNTPRFTELSGPYVQRIFEVVGHPIDIRVGIRNFPEVNVVSDAQLFEELDFSQIIPTESHSAIELTINRKARIDGFLLWLNLFTIEDQAIDVLREDSNLLPVFFPAFSPPVVVSEGDVIRAVCSVGPSDRDATPDYSLKGTLQRKTGETVDFHYQSFYSREYFKQSGFHRLLFANGWESNFEPLVQLGPTLSGWLKDRLPYYSVPSSFEILKSLPVLPNGKVDRQRLPAPEDVTLQRRSSYQPPRNPIEKKLVELWAGVLGIERVGVNDNFFELGGDSIVSIQLVSRGRREGIGITVNQVFQYPTIAELSLVAQVSETLTATQGPVSGEVALTPIQLWFFEQDFINPHHSNQALFFEVRLPLSSTLISQATQAVVEHHDALRIRFERTPEGWRQFHFDGSQPINVEITDLSNVPASQQTAAMETAAGLVQASLNISNGPMVRVALFDLGPNRSQYLLFVIHHLVIDTVSWRILMEDFWTAYAQLARGEGVELPPKTTSFQSWATRISDYAQSPSLREELSYWRRPLEFTRALPVDRATGENTVASAATLTVKLNSQDTRALLQEVPKAYQTQINDVLLTALVQAFERWTGEPSLYLELEGHGREDIGGGLDVSRTVGWFTSLFPVQLSLAGTTDSGEALKSIKEQLRRIPNRGIGYGLLRYLCGDENISKQLQSLPQAEITFNYLGQFGQGQPEGSPIVTAATSYGPLASPQEYRRTLLDISGALAEGELQFVWTYSENLHRRSTIVNLADDFIEALQLLIQHCQAAEAGGFTPSDFSKARLSQKELDRFLVDLEKQVGGTSQ